MYFKWVDIYRVLNAMSNDANTNDEVRGLFAAFALVLHIIRMNFVTGEPAFARSVMKDFLDANTAPPFCYSSHWTELRDFMTDAPTETDLDFPAIIDLVMAASTAQKGSFVQWRALMKVAAANLELMSEQVPISDLLEITDALVKLARDHLAWVPVAGEYLELSADLYDRIRQIPPDQGRARYILDVIQVLISMV